MIRYIRIAILLTILLIVTGSQWLTSSRLSGWERPLWMSIYPVLADPGAGVRSYTENLKADALTPS